ncbi:unnamed protein product [Amoebophrya sp. A120]|nr:unnamed protein product [Amoebophrya sp. A120]|eukprot:GSA120T00016553001.1
MTAHEQATDAKKTGDDNAPGSTSTYSNDEAEEEITRSECEDCSLNTTFSSSRNSGTEVDGQGSDSGSDEDVEDGDEDDYYSEGNLPTSFFPSLAQDYDEMFFHRFRPLANRREYPTLLDTEIFAGESTTESAGLYDEKSPFGSDEPKLIMRLREALQMCEQLRNRIPKFGKAFFLAHLVEMILFLFCCKTTRASFTDLCFSEAFNLNFQGAVFALLGIVFGTIGFCRFSGPVRLTFEIVGFSAAFLHILVVALYHTCRFFLAASTDALLDSIVDTKIWHSWISVAVAFLSGFAAPVFHEALIDITSDKTNPEEEDVSDLVWELFYVS